MVTRQKPDSPFFNRYDPDNDLTEQEAQEKRDEEDQRWDEMMEMSDEESDKLLDAELTVAVQKYNAWWSKLSLAEQIAHRRRTALRSCITCRILMRQWPIPKDWNETENGEYFMYTNAKKNLRKTQMRLLMIREWRKTGIYPGEG